MTRELFSQTHKNVEEKTMCAHRFHRFSQKKKSEIICVNP